MTTRTRALVGAAVLASVPIVSLAVPRSQETVSLDNGLVRIRWSLSGGHLKPLEVVDRKTGQALQRADWDFQIDLADGTTIDSSDLTVSRPPMSVAVHPDNKSPKMADRIAGRQLHIELEDPKNRLTASLVIELKAGSRYVREAATVTAGASDVKIKRLRLVSVHKADMKVDGSATGSPLASGTSFAGVEDPLSSAEVSGGWANAWLDRKLPLEAHKQWTVSSVFGFTDPGQLRRGFLEYVERERAHPYRTFLHYNSWYDIGYFTPYNEKDCVDAIHAFNLELAKKRGVKLSSFLFDDGWDNTSTVWEFHSGFPNGFLPVKAAAAEVGASPGIWLSPWGGYGDPRERRLATGKKLGYEIDSEGYALSGPKYFERFSQVTKELVQKYGINQFKLDGTGSPDKQYPGSAFGSDFEAAIALIHDLRTAKPDLFINLTTGTWPSPFWTRYADSIWRGGWDHSFAGVGTNRQQWITYRDGDTYTGVVKRGPLYPLNSLMLHGIIYAQHADRLNVDPHNDFRSEVRDYFSTGTQLQEMYITPRLLTAQNWDDLAEAAKWSAGNQDVLKDTHWVGGNPMRLEVYGWASWNRRKGILTLRNPSDHAQSYSVDLQKVFELPRGAAKTYSLHSPWKEDREDAPFEMTAGKSKVFDLKPFQVLVLEADPR